MDVAVTIVGAVSTDELRSLRTWLVGEHELRGRVRLVERPPGRDELGGGIVEAVLVALGSGGAVTTLVAGVVSWVRSRSDRRHPSTPVTVKLTFQDGASVEVSATVAGLWSPRELGSHIDRLSATVAGHAGASDGNRLLPPAPSGGQPVDGTQGL
jgi:hypothetical protein